MELLTISDCVTLIIGIIFLVMGIVKTDTKKFTLSAIFLSISALISFLISFLGIIIY